MKNKFIAAALLLPGLLIAQNQVVNAQFDLRGRDCSGGFGTCNPPQITTSAPTTGVSAVATKAGENQLRVVLKNSTLNDQEQKSLYGKLLRDVQATDKLYFNINSITLLDRSCLTLLGLNPAYNAISVGDYLLSIKGEDTEIIFDLKPGQ